MQGSWESQVVSRLREHRRDGCSFDIAWSMATMEFPPPGGTRGAQVPQLFDETWQVPTTQLAFFRQMCENAWHDVRGPVGSGQGPALRDFAPSMLREVDADPVSRGHVRVAA